jgi:hypothetical protein
MSEHDRDDQGYIAPPMEPVRSQRLDVRDPKLDHHAIDEAIAHHRQQEEATEGKLHWWQRLFHRR